MMCVSLPCDGVSTYDKTVQYTSVLSSFASVLRTDRGVKETVYLSVGGREVAAKVNYGHYFGFRPLFSANTRFVFAIITLPISNLASRYSFSKECSHG